MNGAGEPIRIVAAAIADDDGRVLLVRKRGSTVFIQPGGKRESGEDARATLVRELAEELGAGLDPAALRSLGSFEEAAVNEPGRRVRADAYVVRLAGEPVPSGEIEEIAWLPALPPYPVPVAPLSALRILPALRAFLAAAERDAEEKAAPVPAAPARVDVPVPAPNLAVLPTLSLVK